MVAAMSDFAASAVATRDVAPRALGAYRAFASSLLCFTALVNAVR
jgi:hypothetical protein